MSSFNNSNSTNVSFGSCDSKSDYENPLEDSGIKALFIILYSIVFICAFIGNILVITVVLKHRRMRTITNFFLANLAVADLAVGIFCVLPNLSVNLSPNWFLGRTMCKLYYFVQAMSYTASITILTVISIERYVAIIYPLRAKQLTTMCLLRVTVLLIWLISAASGIPFLIVYDQVSILVPACVSTPPSVMNFCMPIHDINMRAYNTSNFLIWFLIPLCLMTTLYVHISVVLWKSSSQSPQSGLRTHNPRQMHAYNASDTKQHASPSAPLKSRCNGKPQQKSHNKPENALLARRKVIRLLIAVLMSFTLCVLPYYVWKMWQMWTEPSFNNWELLLTPITFVIFYLNSALNPLLYAFLSDKFRQSLIEVLTCKVHKRANFTLKTIASTA
ncbi:hypothetical protein CAPTEDRAFT_89772 [Capitella teleta]|uniref:G-protein coupled receptors family 1 profile domain-containing protein n=1 Tax=Capitella teleta TaxID=283909 RepID=R7TBF3_CAPTE|nr:hypothetical protein CAPTEDRAFT_89772 [Capitella teleta]|eukprot:ELT88344.1 hypothetical protein CAPTEDRAFT_89772 [Capitella teleta]